jgi:hypothetical protein
MITFEINGRKADIDDMPNMLERAMFEGVIQSLKDKVNAHFTADEQAQLNICISGDSIETLTNMNVTGPDHLIARLRESLEG